MQHKQYEKNVQLHFVIDQKILSSKLEARDYI